MEEFNKRKQLKPIFMEFHLYCKMFQVIKHFSNLKLKKIMTNLETFMEKQGDFSFFFYIY